MTALEIEFLVGLYALVTSVSLPFSNRVVGAFSVDLAKLVFGIVLVLFAFLHVGAFLF